MHSGGMTKSVTSRFLSSKSCMWPDGEMVEGNVGEMDMWLFFTAGSRGLANLDTVNMVSFTFSSWLVLEISDYKTTKGIKREESKN